MLRIRLTRTGRRNLAHYRIVLAEKTAPVKGKFIERLGWYNPHSKKIGFDKDRILNWLNKGAQPSDKVSKLLTLNKVNHKLIVVKQKVPRKPKSGSQPSVSVGKKQPNPENSTNNANEAIQNPKDNNKANHPMQAQET